MITFIKNESGASVIEYSIVIGVLIALFAVGYGITMDNIWSPVNALAETLANISES